MRYLFSAFQASGCGKAADQSTRDVRAVVPCQLSVDVGNAEHAPKLRTRDAEHTCRRAGCYGDTSLSGGQRAGLLAGLLGLLTSRQNAFTDTGRNSTTEARSEGQSTTFDSAASQHARGCLCDLLHDQTRVVRQRLQRRAYALGGVEFLARLLQLRRVLRVEPGICCLRVVVTCGFGEATCCAARNDVTKANNALRHAADAT
ncbi:hypothetical protein D9M69_487170 [compost metagenome]